MLRFRLRTLLIVVTLCSLLFAGYYWQRRRVEEQRAIVQALEEKGFFLWYMLYDEKGNYSDGGMDLYGPKWLRDILGDHYFADEVVLEFPEDFGRREQVQPNGFYEDGSRVFDPVLIAHGSLSDIELAGQLWDLGGALLDISYDDFDKEVIADIKSLLPDCKLYEMRYLHWVEMKLNDEPTNNSD